MKKLLIAAMAMLLFSCSNDDTENQDKPLYQCDNAYPYSVTLISQEAVDAFVANNYCAVTGKMIIGSENGFVSDITDLSGLASLQGIGEYLVVANNPKLKNLEGLTNLIEVSGGVEVRQNDSLINLHGLRGLKRTKTFSVSSNAALTSLEGLENLHTVGSLSIKDNKNLTTLKGFDKVTDVSAIIIGDNNKITTLAPLGTIKAGSISVFGNGLLTDLKGLEKTRDVSSIYIGDNPKLQSLEGLQNISKVENSLTISNNESLISFSVLRGITRFGKMSPSLIRISNNSRITSMDGFQNIKDFEGFIEIRSNISLNNFCDIKNLLTSSKPEITSYIAGNLYNPEKADFLDGKCSQ